MTKLEQLQADLESLSRRKQDAEDMVVAAQNEVADAKAEAQEIADEYDSLAKIIDTIVEEVDAIKATFQDALGILLIAHKAGRATDGDYKTVYESCGIGLPEELQPALDEEDAEESCGGPELQSTGT